MKTLREIISANISFMRRKKFPGVGGSKRCAEAFGISPQQWSPWERGKRLPSEKSIEKIADFFGVSVDFLYTDQDYGENVYGGDVFAIMVDMSGFKKNYEGTYHPQFLSAMASIAINKFVKEVYSEIHMRRSAMNMISSSLKEMIDDSYREKLPVQDELADNPSE